MNNNTIMNVVYKITRGLFYKFWYVFKFPLIPKGKNKKGTSREENSLEDGRNFGILLFLLMKILKLTRDIADAKFTSRIE